MQTIERVRGMLDAAPDDVAHLDSLRDALLKQFAGYGYRPVQAPIIEFAELFLRKSGADVSARMYSFTDQGGRRLALRPELTAPVLRAFLQHGAPLLPARLSYAGPVFRYEKPQRGRYRQFTQVGVELIGAEPPYADAELLAMTAEAPELLGIGETRMVIGHLGILLSFLSALEVDGRTEAILLQGLETLKKGRDGAHALRRLLGLDIQVGESGADMPPGPQGDPKVQAILAEMPRQDAILLVRSLLGSINTDVGGGREPEEIVDRLLERLRAGDQRSKAERAIAFILELSELAGPRHLALHRAGDLIERYGLSPRPIEELERICSALDSMRFDWSNVTIDLSLGRGLQYYTGLVFEVYGNGLGSEDQLCGGGRYDGLARALGSKQAIPALGCSWGVERLRLASAAPTDDSALLDAVVVPSAASFGYGAEIARVLRMSGQRVELELRERRLSASIAYAARRKARWLLVAGEHEVAEQTVSARHMGTGSERMLRLEMLRAEGLPQA